VRGELFERLQVTQLGESIDLAAGQQAAIVRAYGLDHDSEILTAVLSFEPLGSASGEAFATGIVRWGVGAHQNEAEVDFLNGAVISVPASYLEVIARNDGARRVRVSASMGYGTRSAAGIPTVFRTVRMGAMTNTPPTNEQTVPIPRWAAVGITGFAETNAQFTLSVLDFNGVPMFTQLNPEAGQSFPVLNGSAAVNITVLPSSPVGLSRAFLQYALVL
jgi:hypothetical protein